MKKLAHVLYEEERSRDPCSSHQFQFFFGGGGFPAVSVALNAALIHSCSLDAGIMSMNVFKRVDIQLWDRDAVGTVPTGPAERSNRAALMYSGFQFETVKLWWLSCVLNPVFNMSYTLLACTTSLILIFEMRIADENRCLLCQET